MIRMEKKLSALDIRSSLPLATVLALIVLLATVGVWFLGRRFASEDGSPRELVIVTGPATGIYHALGSALGRLLESGGVVDSAVVIPTEGSVANARRISGLDGGADLAFLQSDTPVDSDVRLIAPLYDEVLHILISARVADDVAGVDDLNDRRLSLGTARSGTRQVAQAVLRHFRVEPGADLALSPEETVAGLVDGSIDAAFLLSAIPSPTIRRLTESGAVRFLSLGDAQEIGNEADALALVEPRLTAFTIPRATYARFPVRPVRTVTVSALLVARRDLDAELTRDVTTMLFEHRLGLTDDGGRELAVAERIRDEYHPERSLIPYHDGAVAYYRREEPPFFVAYAEAISLGLTLAVGAYSGWVALRQWMKRRRKDRIDAYLLEVERRTRNLLSLPSRELVELRDALDEIRHRALADLVAERLQADESFTIFQNYLREIGRAHV